MAGAGPCNKSFCSDYMLLNPEESGVLDVWKILFSSNIGNRDFVDCPPGTREPLGRRWLIFVSVMVQKLLQATAKPMAASGAAIEHWLNLVSANGGFFSLILNSFQGTILPLNKL